MFKVTLRTANNNQIRTAAFSNVCTLLRLILLFYYAMTCAYLSNMALKRHYYVQRYKASKYNYFMLYYIKSNKIPIPSGVA